MKIINPLINANINLTQKGFFFSCSSRSHKTLPVKEAEEPIDFTIERPRWSHTFRIRQLCAGVLSAMLLVILGKRHKKIPFR